MVAVAQRRDEGVTDRRVVAGEPRVARDRPAEQERLPRARDESRDALADPLPIALRHIREAEGAPDRQDAIVHEHDRDAVGREDAREAARRAFEQRLRVALRAHDLLELARRFRPRLELRGGTLDPPERVLLDELERDERRQAAEPRRFLIAERPAHA